MESTTNNLKMTYGNPNKLNSRNEKVIQLLKIKNKDETNATKQKAPKNKNIKEIDASDNGLDKLSSFDEVKNAAYTIKKKNKSKERKHNPIDSDDTF